MPVASHPLDGSPPAPPLILGTHGRCSGPHGSSLHGHDALVILNTGGHTVERAGRRHRVAGISCLTRRFHHTPVPPWTLAQIQTLVTCAEHLEAGKFDTFWEVRSVRAEARDCRHPGSVLHVRAALQVANLGGNELLDGVPGFPDAARSFMIGVLSNTFQKLEVRLRLPPLQGERDEKQQLTNLSCAGRDLHGPPRLRVSRSRGVRVESQRRD